MSREEREARLRETAAQLDRACAVPVRTLENGTRYILQSDLPDELARKLQHYLMGSTVPMHGCAYLTDYIHWLETLERQIRVLAVPTVVEQGDVVLTHWNVIQEIETFLVGIVAETGKARTTSGIETFDLQNMLVTTRSGRRYWLAGPPVRDHKIEQAMSWPALRAANLLESWV